MQDGLAGSVRQNIKTMGLGNLEHYQGQRGTFHNDGDNSSKIHHNPKYICT